MQLQLSRPTKSVSLISPFHVAPSPARFGFWHWGTRNHLRLYANGSGAHPVADDKRPFQGRMFGRSPDLRVKALGWPSRAYPSGTISRARRLQLRGQLQNWRRKRRTAFPIASGCVPGTEHGALMAEKLGHGQLSIAASEGSSANFAGVLVATF